MLEFEKIDLENKHVFQGNDFPIAFKLKVPSESVKKTLLFLKERAEEGYFNDLLSKHGAVVLRNLGGSDADILAQYIKTISINSGDEFFVQKGSVAQRTEINEILTTANEGLPSRIIFQHNEFSRFIKYPTKLFFVCSKINGEGGETPIVHGGEFFNDVFKKEPEFTKELAKKGLYMEQIWPLDTSNNTSWSDKFCFGKDIDKNRDDIEQQKTIAGKLAEVTVSADYEWDTNNNFVVHQHTKAIRIYKPRQGKEFPCFFNSIATFYGNFKHGMGGHKKTTSIKFDDGKDISTQYLDTILQSSIELAYSHKWVQGDIVIIDNYQVSHGRLPWKGERKILVSMWDTPNKDEFLPWEG